MVFRSTPRRRLAALSPCAVTYSIAVSRCCTFHRCRGAIFNSLPALSPSRPSPGAGYRRSVRRVPFSGAYSLRKRLRRQGPRL